MGNLLPGIWVDSTSASWVTEPSLLVLRLQIDSKARGGRFGLQISTCVIYLCNNSACRKGRQLVCDWRHTHTHKIITLLLTPRQHEEVLWFSSGVGELRAWFWRRRWQLRVQSCRRKFHWQSLHCRAAPSHCWGDHRWRWEGTAQTRWCHLFLFSPLFFFISMHLAQTKCVSHVTEQGCNPMPFPQDGCSFASLYLGYIDAN